MKTEKIINIIKDNLKTLFAALLIAVLIRSLMVQPFYIPSSSMEPTLLIGDKNIVSKFSYGYSKHFHLVLIFQIIASFQKSSARRFGCFQNTLR